MNKASKGLLGLFLALFILISGVCAGGNDFDILDFLPTIIKKKKIGNGVAKPFFLVPGVSTPVTITTYIPDANLVAGSVQLKQSSSAGTMVIGNLVDTGNRVFSITNNFQGDNGGVIKLSISATLGTLNKTVATLDIQVLNVPTIQNATQYNQAIDNIFTALVSTRNNITTLKNPGTPSSQFSANLSLATDRLLSVYANMEAIYRTETHSPSNYPRWPSFIPKFGSACQNLYNIDQKKKIFIDHPDDPAVADILAYATWPRDTYLSTREGRKWIADDYYANGPGLQSTLQEVNNIAIQQEGGQFTGLAGGAIGDLFSGIRGWLINKGINVGISKIIDIFISNNGQIGMAVVELQDGETVEVPVGSHDVLFSFKGVLDRAIERNIPVNANTNTTVSIAPGEVKLCKFKYNDLGNLGGGWVFAYGINSSGQVVGSSFTSTLFSHAYLWTPSAGMQDLGNLGGNTSFAHGINSIGQVVGTLLTSTNSQHAFFWTPSGGMQDLGTLGGNTSFAYGINSIGQVVGSSFTSTNSSPHAFLWAPSGGMQYLGTLGGISSQANGINDSGQVVGASAKSNSDLSHGFLWTQSGGMQDLGTLGTAPWWTEAYAINNIGQIVGFSDVGGWQHAFLWTSSGGMQDLGTLGGLNSCANGINSNGQVVGNSEILGDTHACLWTPSEGWRDLNTLVIDLPTGLVLNQANAINDAGQIVGNASNGAFAFLLTPVP